MSRYNKAFLYGDIILAKFRNCLPPGPSFNLLVSSKSGHKSNLFNFFNSSLPIVLCSCQSRFITFNRHRLYKIPFSSGATLTEKHNKNIFLNFNYVHTRSFSCFVPTNRDTSLVTKPLINVPSFSKNQSLNFSVSNFNLIRNKLKLHYIVKSSPKSIQPYLHLIRFDKPTGTWLLFLPCACSIGMATSAGNLPDLKILTLFGIGAFLMRGAGCTINDMWDKNFDAKVKRTKDRPLASEKLSYLQALQFLSIQLTAALIVLLQLNWYSIFLGASSLSMVVIYPLMKRITYWPQLVLGLTFNWGAMLGWSAVQGSCYWPVVLPLYCSFVMWTLYYDTIYAHQDKKDDKFLGIKSTALKFGDNTKKWLTGFSATMTGGLLIAGLLNSQTLPYYAAVIYSSYIMSEQIKTLDIDSENQCGQLFRDNRNIGIILFIGILLGTYFKS